MKPSTAPRFLRMSLLTQALLVNSAVVVIALSGLTWLFVAALENSFQKQMELRAESAAVFIATESELALLVGDQAALQQLARNAIAAEDVVYLRVTEASGMVLELGRAGFPLAEIPGLSRSSASRTAVRTFRARGRQFPIIEAVRAVSTGNRVIEWESEGYSGRVLGTVQVGISTESQQRMLAATIRKALGGACATVLLIILLNFLHLRGLLLPLKALIGFTKRVGGGDLTAIAAAPHDDELGEVTEAFNGMVRKMAESRERMAEAQQRLIELSRESGMAEVATGVLHNVGNVLNSVNISTTVVAGKIRELRVDNLVAVVEMLHQHQEDLAKFLRSDPKGERLLPYLAKLGRHFQDERRVLVKELELLQENIGHIKEIVATQQDYAKVTGLIEELGLARLVDDAVRIAGPGLGRDGIRIERDFDVLPKTAADKHKILQILLNLVRNAQQAIKERPEAPLTIWIRIRRMEGNRARIEVRDAGVGLARENLTRIFAHGFTTKRDGHGFGLHSGALAAKQMGGALWVESAGPGLGATFILELPLRAAAGETAERSAA